MIILYNPDRMADAILESPDPRAAVIRLVKTRTEALRHVERLQDENRLLASVLADERRLRQRAYGWYQRRLNGRLMWLVDAMVGLQGRSGLFTVARGKQRLP